MWELVEKKWEWLCKTIPGGAVSVIFLLLFLQAQIKAGEVEAGRDAERKRHAEEIALAMSRAADESTGKAHAYEIALKQKEEIKGLKVRLFWLTRDSSLLYNP